ncbi:MAG: hypothetical protein J6J71_01370 [Prevotella sp.]|nr:hypothetical protein [Prevotella sp.]
MDAFGAEDRVEITTRELIAMLDERAKAETAFNVAMAMLREGVKPETVRAVFGLKNDIQPELLNCKIKEKERKNNAE